MVTFVCFGYETKIVDTVVRFIDIVLYRLILLRDDLAQFEARLPANISNIVDKLLGVRIPVEPFFIIHQPFNGL